MNPEEPQSLFTFPEVYASLHLPISALDCGRKCAPYNEYGAPFCCDTRHAVPTAYHTEWAYLSTHTDLWHPWQAETEAETRRLQEQTPPNQVLIECLGHQHCQRSFRALTCRTFPFFPYIDQAGNFVGLSYYWDFEDRCWVISHLETVSQEYIAAFVSTFDRLFAAWPTEKAQFRHHSSVMRQVFGRRHQSIPLLRRDGELCAVSTRTGEITMLHPDQLPRCGPYAIAATLRFPDEYDER
jgi:hypothetical protein